MRAVPKWVERIHEENEEKDQAGYVDETLYLS